MATVHQIGQATLNGVSASSISITTTETINAGDTCVILFTGVNVQSSSITDGANTWTLADNVQYIGDQSIWYCANHGSLNSGSKITVNFPSFPAVGAVATLYRIVGGAAFASSGNNHAASGTPTVSTSSSVKAVAILFGCGQNQNGAWTGVGGIWVDDYNGKAVDYFIQSHAIAGSGIQTYNPTFTGSAWGLVIAAFNQPASGAFLLFA